MPKDTTKQCSKLQKRGGPYHAQCNKLDNPTHRAPRSRAAMLARRRELDALRITRVSADAGKPDVYYAYDDADAIKLISMETPLPGVRIQRRDILIAREAATAPRNALVAVIRENDDEVVLGLWVKGGERVITLTLPCGDERLFLREELTYVGLIIGYIRREYRHTVKPPVHVFRTGGA